MDAAPRTIDASGLLVREGGGFALHGDDGGRWRLVLGRVPIDLVEKRVRVIGIVLEDGLVDAEGIQPA